LLFSVHTLSGLLVSFSLTPKFKALPVIFVLKVAYLRVFSTAIFSVYSRTPSPELSLFHRTPAIPVSLFPVSHFIRLLFSVSLPYFFFLAPPHKPFLTPNLLLKDFATLHSSFCLTSPPPFSEYPVAPTPQALAAPLSPSPAQFLYTFLPLCFRDPTPR